MGLALAIDFGKAPLRCQRRGVKDRVGITQTLEDLFRPDGLALIEGDEHRRTRLQMLKRIHPIGHRRLLSPRGGNAIVPGRPSLRSPRQQGLIAMQHHVVFLVAQGAKNGELLGGGVVQQG